LLSSNRGIGNTPRAARSPRAEGTSRVHLPRSLLHDVEDFFQTDLSAVQFYETTWVRKLGARALACGDRVCFDRSRFNPDTAPGGGTYYLRDFNTAAQSFKLEPIAARAHSDPEIETVVTSLGREPGGGLIVMPDFFMFNHVEAIILLAARNKVPAIYPWRFVVAKSGGLLSYGPDLRDIVRRGAPYVDQILRGAKPADLPVQVPVKFEMAVNAKTAKTLGLTVPPSMLLLADEVIE